MSEHTDSPRRVRTEAERSTIGAITGAVGVQLVARAVGMLASVTTIALTTRALGVEGYGLLTTAVVFAGLWSSLTELGVGAVIVRRVSSNQDRLRELVGLNLGLSLVYCVPLAVVAGAVGLLVYHDQPRVHAALLVVCASLVPQTLSTCFNPVFMVSVRFAGVALADVGARVASLLATLVVVGLDAGLVWFAVVQLAPAVVQLVVMVLGARRVIAVRPRFAWRAAADLLRESLPQTGVLIVGVLYWRADALILTLLGTVRDVGAYGLAYTVAFTTSVLSSFYLASSLSTMSRLFAEDRVAFVGFVRSGIEVMLVVALPLAVLGGILAHPVVVLLGSTAFADPATAPLVLLLVSVGLTFLNGLLGQALFASHDQRFLLRLNIVNLLANVVLNVVLVPAYGAEGAAVALLVSEVSGLVVTSQRLRRQRGLQMPWRFLAHLTAPLALSAGVALLVASLPILLALAVTGLTYLAANLVLGPVRIDTLRRLRGGSPAIAT